MRMALTILEVSVPSNLELQWPRLMQGGSAAPSLEPVAQGSIFVAADRLYGDANSRLATALALASGPALFQDAANPLQSGDDS